jgi:hypothetical protein
MRFIYVIGKFLKIILYLAFVDYNYYACLLHHSCVHILLCIRVVGRIICLLRQIYLEENIPTVLFYSTILTILSWLWWTSFQPTSNLFSAGESRANAALFGASGATTSPPNFTSHLPHRSRRYPLFRAARGFRMACRTLAKRIRSSLYLYQSATSRIAS